MYKDEEGIEWILETAEDPQSKSSEIRTKPLTRKQNRKQYSAKMMLHRNEVFISKAPYSSIFSEHWKSINPFNTYDHSEAGDFVKLEDY